MSNSVPNTSWAGLHKGCKSGAKQQRVLRTVGCVLAALAALLAATSAQAADPDAPVAALYPAYTELYSMADSATLDASASYSPTDASLKYSWREDPANPAKGLIPQESEYMDSLTVYFPRPGRYKFMLRVTDGNFSGGRAEDNGDAVAVVDVPGMEGSAFVVPTEGTIKETDVKMMMFNLTEEAQQALTYGDTPYQTFASGTNFTVSSDWYNDSPRYPEGEFPMPGEGEYAAMQAGHHEEVHVGVYTPDGLPGAHWRDGEVGGRYFVDDGFSSWQIAESGGNGFRLIGASRFSNMPNPGPWWILDSPPSEEVKNRLRATLVRDVAITDSKGHYAFENLTFGSQYWGYNYDSGSYEWMAQLEPYVLAWSKEPDFLPSNTERVYLNALTTQRDWGLARPNITSLTGKVYDRNTGSGLGGASFSIIAGVNIVYSDVTESDGSFSLSNVPKGTWTMQLWKSGYRTELRNVQVVSSMASLKVSMTPDVNTTRFSGVVQVAETGEAVPNARIVLGTGTVVYSDSTGVFRLTNMPAGNLTAYVEHENFETLRVNNITLEPGENTYTFDLNVKGGGPVVSGQLTWKIAQGETEGAPAGGLRVGIVDPTSASASQPYTFIRSAVTDAAGYFSMRDCPLGSGLKIAVAGYAVSGGEPLVDVSENTTVNLELADAKPALPSDAFDIALGISVLGAPINGNSVILDSMAQTVQLTVSALSQVQTSQLYGSMFHLLDANADHSLTPAELDVDTPSALLTPIVTDLLGTDGLGLEFTRRDRSGDGQLTEEEAVRQTLTGGQFALFAAEESLGELTVEGLTAYSCEGESPTVSRFLVLCENMNSSAQDPQAEPQDADLFNLLDANSDGFLSFAEATAPYIELVNNWDVIDVTDPQAGPPDDLVSIDEIKLAFDVNHRISQATHDYFVNGINFVYNRLDGGDTPDGLLAQDEVMAGIPTAVEYRQINYGRGDGLSLEEIQSVIRAALTVNELCKMRDYLLSPSTILGSNKLPRTVFQLLDTSGNGMLDLDESTVIHPTSAEFAFLDVNGNGKLTLGELTDVSGTLTSSAFAAAVDYYSDRFETYDTNSDGKLSRTEAGQSRPTELEFDAIDQSADGALSLAELQTYVNDHPDTETGQLAQSLYSAFGCLDADLSEDLDDQETAGVGSLPMDTVSWRESLNNPVLGLFPGGSETDTQVTLNFPLPGTYQFFVQAGCGSALSATKSVFVYVPGLQGQVTLSNSDGTQFVPNVVVRAYTDYQSAVLWQDNPNIKGSTYTDARGYFILETLTTGHYWLAAKGLGTIPNLVTVGGTNYGPSGYAANPSKVSKPIEIGLRRKLYTIGGKVYHGSVSATNLLENARVIVAPGIESEVLQTSSDRDGNYKLESVPAGRTNVMVIPDPLSRDSQGRQLHLQTVTQLMDISANSSTVNFVVPELDLPTSNAYATLTGYVMASVAGFQPMPVANAEIILGGGFARAISGQDGSYTIPNLPTGAYAGVVRKDGYETQSLGGTGGVVELQAGLNSKNFQLTTKVSAAGKPMSAHMPAIAGLVKNASGLPVAGVKIEVLIPPLVTSSDGAVSTATSMLVARQAISDTTGYYVLTNLPATRHTLRVTYPPSTGNDGVIIVNVTGNLDLPITPETVSPDADGDGIPNALENMVNDTDSDGDPNGEDLDADGDGIPDAIEGVIDTDHDGTPNYLDTDSDNDGMMDSAETVVDTDGDGIPDYLDTDSDDDGISDEEENRLGMHPYEFGSTADLTLDSDQDGLTNIQELNGTPPTNLARVDTDSDGLNDYDEMVSYETDPTQFDTDNDGLPDGWEVANGMEPLDNGVDNVSTATPRDGDPVNGASGDIDNDGLSNQLEYQNYPYDTGAKALLQPLVAQADADADGIPNAIEADLGTDPDQADTDGDGIPDGWEVQHGMNPLDDGTTDPDNGASGDIDGDRVANLVDYLNHAGEMGSNPIIADTDGDGIPDYQEMIAGTNPRVVDEIPQTDSDEDGLPDAWEIRYGLDAQSAVDADGAAGDVDDDGLSNLEEYQAGSDPTKADTDGDELPDAWEVANGLAPNDNGTVDPDNGKDGDPDGDELNNLGENLQGTDPNNADSDEDGLPDGWEARYHLDPLVATGNSGADGDFDADGLTNSQEYTGGTNPNSSDTDSDGLPDAWEVQYRLQANSTSGNNGATGDPDHDSLNNLAEYQHGTNPTLADTDSDGLPDGWEVQQGFSPVDNGSTNVINGPNGDADNDGASNVQELLHETDPNNGDSDGDGLLDGWEVRYGMDPLNDQPANQDQAPSADPDGDGLTNYEESHYRFSSTSQVGTSPFSTDTDSDGLSDFDENTRYHTDATTSDTDGDGMPDGWEVEHTLDPLDNGSQNPANGPAADPDSDALPNLQEYTYGADPLNADTDGDGATDGYEVEIGRNPANENDGFVIAPSPSAPQVQAAAGSTEVTLTVRSEGRVFADVDWTATVNAGLPAFLSLDGQGGTQATGTTGTGGTSTLRIYYTQNATANPRTGSIAIVLADGTSLNLVVTQRELVTPVLGIDMNGDHQVDNLDVLNVDATAASATYSFGVLNTGGGDLNYTATVQETGSFVSITDGATGQSGSYVWVHCDANALGEARTAHVIVTAVDGDGNAISGSPATVTITQGACAVTGAVTNVAAQPGEAANEVVLTWTAVEGADSYDVYAGVTNDFAAAQLVGLRGNATGTTFTDSDASNLITLIPGCSGNTVPATQIFYWVVAKNACGDSEAGTPASTIVGGTAAKSAGLTSPGFAGNLVLFAMAALALLLSRKGVKTYHE